MNKQEFEERTGYTILDDHYKEIEAMYLEAGEDIDKDTFCNDFKQHSDSVLLQRFFQQSEKLKSKLDTFRAQTLETARLLIKEAAKSDNAALRNHAIKMLGPNVYLREKIKLGIAFDCADYELVTEFL